MKFTFKNLKINIYNLMRQCRYSYQGADEKTGQWIFTRPLSPSGYPRFHIYVNRDEKTSETIINLHLDQKGQAIKELRHIVANTKAK